MVKLNKIPGRIWKALASKKYPMKTWDSGDSKPEEKGVTKAPLWKVGNL